MYTKKKSSGTITYGAGITLAIIGMMIAGGEPTTTPWWFPGALGIALMVAGGGLCYLRWRLGQR